MTRRATLLLLLVVGVVVGAAPASADSGCIVPAGEVPLGAPGARLEHEDVDVRVNGALAQVTVRQTFGGIVPRAAGLQYVLPIEAGSGGHDVRVLVDGEPLATQLLTGEDARQWLLDAMARTRRRGLACFWGRDLLVASLGELAGPRQRTVEVRRDLRLAPAGGVRSFIHRSGCLAGSALLRVRVEIVGPEAAGPLWSPTADVTLTRRDPQHVEAMHGGSIDERSAPFVLAWGDGGPGGHTLLTTHWPRGSESGWFACVVAPPAADNPTATAPAPLARTLILVLDATASMRGRSIERVRRAITRIFPTLRTRDRLMVIAYGEQLQCWPDAPAPASDDVKHDAVSWLGRLRPAGGGDLSAALDMALQAPRSPDHVTQVVLVTDGRPIQGDVDEGDLLARAARGLGDPPASVHTIALGVDAPSTLLDRLALSSRGTPTTISPREDGGAVLGEVLARLGHVWLAEPEVDLSALGALDVEPPPDRLSDLVLGEPIVLLGRYTKPGVADIVLRGREGLTRRERHQLHQAAEPGQGLGLDVIERVSAVRRAAHLVDRLRLDGSDDPTLLLALLQLGAQYGAVTEYTASLADPDAPPPGRFDEHVGLARALLVDLRRLTSGASAMAQAKGNQGRRAAQRVPADDVPLVVSSPGGRDLEVVRLAGVRQRGGRTFFLRTGQGWVEGTVNSYEGVQTVRPGTPAFVELLDDLGPEGVDLFALDGPILLHHRDRVVQVAVD
ncbi:MAG: VWA domain-containing protein [Planctomycetota bacterium]